MNDLAQKVETEKQRTIAARAAHQKAFDELQAMVDTGLTLDCLALTDEFRKTFAEMRTAVLYEFLERDLEHDREVLAQRLGIAKSPIKRFWLRVWG
jgi:nitrate reductase assembly molybdenum cofactor insertion protein NarJ